MNSTTNGRPHALDISAKTDDIQKPLPQRDVLPDKPLSIIQSSKFWVPLDLHDVWTHRELLYFLTWRDLKVRYKQTLLGVVWVVIQPLLMTFVFNIFLGRLARVPSNGIPYAIFAYTGLLPWTFFSGAISVSSNSIVGNANLITKVYFPRMIIPGAAVGAKLVDFAVSFLILIGLMIYYKISVTQNILMLPIFIVLITVFSLGIGMLISALNVKYRDVGAILPVALQLWMFASPIIYSSTLVPAPWRRIYALNPLVGIVEGFRSALFGLEFDWIAITISTVFTFALFICSAYAFRHMESSFADVV